MIPPKAHNPLVSKDIQVYEVSDKEIKPHILQKKINEFQEKQLTN